MPPVLDPKNSKVDGLAFLGLSLARKSVAGHSGSVTHQTAFDLNEVLDRDYEHLFSTNDDGWLVGGGEPGPPSTYKLAAKDSAHVEVMRIGTYRKEWGGVPQEEIVRVMQSGEILIPQIEVLPTAVVANPDTPPELEIRFDMEPAIPDFDNLDAPLPINWQLRFLHNQLFKRFIFPSRFCPGAFHSTILRKAEFRSDQHREQYFDKCEKAVQRWRKIGPQPLNTDRVGPDGKPLPKIAETAGDSRGYGANDDEIMDSRRQDSPADPLLVGAGHGASKGSGHSMVESSKEEYSSGIWLFTDRENISHHFEPNFLPPYDTPEKRMVIMDVLREEWDEQALVWKPCGEGSMTPAKDKPVEVKKPRDAASPEDESLFDSVMERFHQFVWSCCGPSV